jgi:hypothetical protein
VYRRSDGRRVALNRQRIIKFSVEKGMKIISRDRFYTRESYQQLR